VQAEPSLVESAREAGERVRRRMEESASSELAEEADEEQRGKELETALAEKIQQQLDTQLRILRERRSVAHSKEDRHEAERDFHRWWLFAFDLLGASLVVYPEARGPQLEKVVDRAGQAVEDEVPNDVMRDMSSIGAVLQEWKEEYSAHQDTNV
jgi:hypothetical protein